MKKNGMLIEKRRAFLREDFHQNEKGWIGKGRVLFENSWIEKEESHLVRERAMRAVQKRKSGIH